MNSQQKAPNVFTDAGEEWLEDLLNDFVYTKGHNRPEIHDKYGLPREWEFGDYTDGPLPKTNPEYGQLLDTDEDQYLVTGSLTRAFAPINHLKGEKNSRDPRIHLYYYDENFGKVRIYREAKARGYANLFVPVTGWDGRHFRWITMKQASEARRGSLNAASAKQRLKQKDDNWILDDVESGVINGQRVLLDYGQCWYGGDWKVSEAEIIDGPGHPHGTPEQQREHKEYAEWTPEDLDERYDDLDY